MTLIRTFLMTLAYLLFAGVAGATDHYVASGGTAGGDGSINNPWDLRTALNQPASVQPGDTIWVRGGTYPSIFSHLNGTPQSPIIVRNYKDERVTIDGRGDQNAFAVDGSYTWYWGLEVMDSNPTRVSPDRWQRNARSSLPSSISAPRNRSGCPLMASASRCGSPECPRIRAP